MANAASRPVAALAAALLVASPIGFDWISSATPTSARIPHATTLTPVVKEQAKVFATQPVAHVEPGPASQPFHYNGTDADRARAVDCLALAAWYEAGNDKDGQRSVIQVILNRMAHPAFPSSACGVVFQGATRSTGCQFTFTCDGSLDRRRPTTAALAAARVLAEQALNGAVYSAVRQATHYHANYVTPWWGAQLMQLATVGQHIFYSWPGQQGRLRGAKSSSHEIDISKLLEPLGNTEPVAPELVSISDASLNMSAALPNIPVGPNRPAGGPIFTTVDHTKPSGSWAISALSRCAGKSGCQLIAYETPEAEANNSALPATMRDRPMFLFIRDKASGMEVALWDCARVQRPDPTQCLPEAGTEYDRLMRDKRD